MSCNTCTICLDSVIGGQPIGAAYPCGHVFHLECWDGWVASQCSGQPKCAMCNRQSQGFSRLYLDFIGTNDDNVSLSSCSDASSTAGEQEDKDDDAPQCEQEADSAEEDVIPGGSAKNSLTVEDDEPELRKTLPNTTQTSTKKWPSSSNNETNIWLHK